MVNNEVLSIAFWSVNGSCHGGGILTERQGKRNPLSSCPACAGRWLGQSDSRWFGVAFEDCFGQIPEPETPASEVTALFLDPSPHFYLVAPFLGANFYLQLKLNFFSAGKGRNPLFEELLIQSESQFPASRFDQTVNFNTVVLRWRIFFSFHCGNKQILKWGDCCNGDGVLQIGLVTNHE